MKYLKEKYGQWALVTGASSGIGETFAKTLAKYGFNLVMIARNLNKLEELSKELESTFSVNCKVISSDLSEEISVTRILQETEGIDIGLVINNAGYALTGNFIDDEINKQSQMMKVHTLIPMQICHAFANRLVKKGKGGIINVASSAALLPLPDWAIYASSKAFMKSFSESLWYELKSKGVDVIALCPGGVKTNFHKTAQLNSHGLTSQQVVNSALKNIGRKPSVVIGINNKFIAFLLRFLGAKAKTVMGAKAMESMKA